MMTFHDYLDQIPLIHTWDEGTTWVTGGFDRRFLEHIHALVDSQCPDNPAILETGAGNSTICFLFSSPSRLISIAPDTELKSRIQRFCTEQGIDTEPLDFRAARSETELPKLAEETPHSQALDVALIDGNHGYPAVFVDFCYINMLLKPGGILLLDDGPMYSVKELIRLLHEQPEFEFHSRLGKLWAYIKRTDKAFLPDYVGQPYTLRMNERERRGGTSYRTQRPNLLFGTIELAKRGVKLALKAAGRAQHPKVSQNSRTLPWPVRAGFQSL